MSRQLSQYYNINEYHKSKVGEFKRMFATRRARRLNLSLFYKCDSGNTIRHMTMTYEAHNMYTQIIHIHTQT